MLRRLRRSVWTEDRDDRSQIPNFAERHQARALVPTSSVTGPKLRRRRGRLGTSTDRGTRTIASGGIGEQKVNNLRRRDRRGCGNCPWRDISPPSSVAAHKLFDYLQPG